jgi:hypothetical protein
MLSRVKTGLTRIRTTSISLLHPLQGPGKNWRLGTKASHNCEECSRILIERVEGDLDEGKSSASEGAYASRSDRRDSMTYGTHYYHPLLSCDDYFVFLLPKFSL